MSVLCSLRRHGRNLLAGSLLACASPAMAGSAFENVMPILGLPVYSYPEGRVPDSAVLLFSDDNGWGAEEQALASQLSREGALVMGIDSPKVLQRLAQQPEACGDITGEIDNISRNSQFALKTPVYHFPVVAGSGLGGTLALALATQTEPATVEQFRVVDPQPLLPGSRPLCSLQAQAQQAVEGGTRYQVPSGAQPFTIGINLSGQASAASHVLASDWARGNPAVARYRVSSRPASQTLLDDIHEAQRQHASRSAEDVGDLPLEEVPVAGAHDTLAIFYSGDGGWRDLDKDLSAWLQADGLPVVGVDALRYFWHPQTPEQTARDLQRIMRSYKARWKASKVVLIGFSFGADLLPILYNRLTAEEQASVVQITLLGLSRAATFEVNLDSWLNHKPASAVPTLPEVARIRPQLIQCFVGEEDDLNVCGQLSGSGAEVIRTSGGHHFDRDYQGIARRILNGLQQRSATH